MIAAKFRTIPSLVWAAVLIIAAVAVGWTAVKTTTLELLPSLDTSAAPLIGGRPEYALRMAMRAYNANKGQVAPRSLPAVRAAAARMPLDERPYLLEGTEYLQRGDARRAERMFEAGRRLDPRQRWLHLLLLQLYLQNEQYAPAAEELAVLSRLVGPAQSLIATALAQMSVAPETRDTVRETLRRDPPLELSVLSALAGTDIEPARVFAMASPTALAKANAPGGWGSVMVDRLIKNGRYGPALAVWRRINRLPAQANQPLLYDAGLQGLPGTPPFNWKLESGNLGAADLRGNALQINYYGRDTGDLASQLLVLTPGTYRFSQAVTGSQQSGASTITWSIECANAPDRKLLRMPLPLEASGTRRIAAGFTVPQSCPAQLLHLSGAPGEFPTPVNLSIDHLQLERLGGS